MIKQFYYMFIKFYDKIHIIKITIKKINLFIFFFNLNLKLINKFKNK